MEGLIVDVRFTPSDGVSERDSALDMLEAMPGARRITAGTDRGYNTRGFVKGCLKSQATPHETQKQRSAVDRRRWLHTD